MMNATMPPPQPALTAAQSLRAWAHDLTAKRLGISLSALEGVITATLPVNGIIGDEMGLLLYAVPAAELGVPVNRFQNYLNSTAIPGDAMAIEIKAVAGIDVTRWLEDSFVIDPPVQVNSFGPSGWTFKMGEGKKPAANFPSAKNQPRLSRPPADRPCSCCGGSGMTHYQPPLAPVRARRSNCRSNCRPRRPDDEFL